jgi:formate dehydrogenase subunit gamma
MSGTIVRVLSAVVVAVLVGLPGLAFAQSPGAGAILLAQAQTAASPATTAQGDMWRSVNDGKTFTTTLPRNEGGRLIERGGESWRQFRNGPVTQIGGWSLVIVVLSIAAFFAWRGQMKVHGPPSGRLIERFTLFERTAHWTVAISFVVLALSGLMLLFGRHLLLPIVGHGIYSWIAAFAKNSHNFIGPLFSIAIVIAFFTFLRDNIPRAYDVLWLKKGGGLVDDAHVPSHRFNMGEKLWFWGGLFTLGIVVSVSGLFLDFANFGQTRSQMQLAWMIHAVAAVIFMCASLGHIYMGTIGMQGAFRAMRTGYVDETWAREHHEFWHDDIKSGKIPTQRTGTRVARQVGKPAAT